MPEIAVVTVTGEPGEPVHLRDDVFGIEPHEAVLHQAVVRQLADRRQGTASTKTRGFVRGSTRKAWRQKGTGRARQGSRRAPHWRGGGVVFGPHPRSYRQKMPRKMRSLALRSALSSVVREERLVLLDELGLEAPSTRSLRDILFQGSESPYRLVGVARHHAQRAFVGTQPAARPHGRRRRCVPSWTCCVPSGS